MWGNISFSARFLHNAGDARSVRDVSAVFLFALRAGRILAIRNERGWDVPGGHLEEGEDPLIALRREVLEEAAASFDSARLFAELSPTSAGDRVMLCYATCDFTLGEFVSSGVRLEREELRPAVLIGRYHGDRDLLRRLIQAAQEALLQPAISSIQQPVLQHQIA